MLAVEVNRGASLGEPFRRLGVYSRSQRIMTLIADALPQFDVAYLQHDAHFRLRQQALDSVFRQDVAYPRYPSKPIRGSPRFGRVTRHS